MWGTKTAKAALWLSCCVVLSSVAATEPMPEIYPGAAADDDFAFRRRIGIFTAYYADGMSKPTDIDKTQIKSEDDRAGDQPQHSDRDRHAIDVKRIKYHARQSAAESLKGLLEAKIAGHLEISGCKNQHISIDDYALAVAFIVKLNFLVIKKA